MTWKNVSLIEDEFDELDDLTDVISTNRGEQRAPSRHGGDYRRSNKYTEDGYGELDFA